MRLAAAATLALLALAAGSPARAVVVDLDDVSSGTLIDDEFESVNNLNLAMGEGFSVTVQNLGGGPDLATLYDSGLAGGEDPDLEGPPGTNWAGGNLSSPQTATGNVLIVQEAANATEISNGQLTFANGQSSGGNNAPDDQGGGSTITLDFESYLISFGFDWVDLDPIDGAGYSIDFIDTIGGVSVNLGMGEFVDSNSFFYDSTVAWGDSTANRIQEMSATDLGTELGEPSMVAFDRVRFNLGGSGGIAVLRYTTQAPEPSSGALLALGLLILAARRRQRP